MAGEFQVGLLTWQAVSRPVQHACQATESGVQLDLDGYSLESYGRMVDDRIRHDAYVKALRQTVKSGDVVLDIGTGIGLYAMLAAKLGARKVYAVEINPFVRLGREVAESNGLADRIEFIQDLSTRIDLPEKADVILSDMRGVLPYHTQNLLSVRDARERHLAPGGVMMPVGDRIFVALSENQTGVASYRQRWLDNPFDLDLSLVAEEQSTEMRADQVSEDDLLSQPLEVAAVDYTSSLAETGFRYSGPIEATGDGVVNGISVWFEATVLEGITYSSFNDSVYGMAFFPFPEPLEVQSQTIISIRLSAHLVAGDYVWRWGASTVDGLGAKWEFDQNSVTPTGIDLDSVRRRKASYRLTPSQELSGDLLALQLLAEGKSLGEAAAALLEAFPTSIGTMSSALTRVADIAGSYGR